MPHIQHEVFPLPDELDDSGIEDRQRRRERYSLDFNQGSDTNRIEFVFFAWPICTIFFTALTIIKSACREKFKTLLAYFRVLDMEKILL